MTGNSIRRALSSGTEFLTNLTTMLHSRRAALGACLLLLIVGAGANGFAQVSVAQNLTPFGVSNPKNKKWPVDEAARIYFSACDQVARSIRPVNPPHLRASFVLVLGGRIMKRCAMARCLKCA